MLLEILFIPIKINITAVLFYTALQNYHIYVLGCIEITCNNLQQQCIKLERTFTVAVASGHSDIVNTDVAFILTVLVTTSRSFDHDQNNC